jgi:hypothetical protein
MLAVLGLATASMRAAADDAAVAVVRVQVVVRDTHKELNVYHYSKGAKAGEVLVPFFLWGNYARNEAREGELTAAVGDYAHGEVLGAAVAKVLPAKYPVFAVQVVGEGASHWSQAELVRNAREADMHYVLLVDEEFSGVSSAQATSGNDQVSVAEGVRFLLLDVATGKQLHHSKMSAFSFARSGLEAALASGDFYRTHYPVVAEVIAGGIVGELLRTDHLHAMAAAHGRGEAVPALAAVLARYDDPVVIKPKAPTGWQVARLGTPYAKVVEPKSEDRFRFGLRFDVDLLVPEFGQDVDTVEGYIAGAMSTRLDEAGLDAAAMAPLTADVLTAPAGYTGYVVRRKEGTGGQVMLIRMLDKPYVAMLTVVATEDLDGHVARHRSDIEAAFAQARIEIDPGRRTLRPRPYGE